MKLYFMKKEVLDKLKDDLNIIYEKYFTEEDNKWIIDEYGEDAFVEFKEIPDFELESLDSELKINEVEFNNAKILYKNLSFLNESQACDERLWAGLCHTTFYKYLRKRWGYDTRDIKEARKEASAIKSRFFFSGGTRSGLFRNSISKCWWLGHNTFDSSKENSFEKLDIIGNNDISTKISDIFYSYSFVANPTILNGIVRMFKYFHDKDIIISPRKYVRPAIQFLNTVGGGVLLDYLSEEDIAKIMIDKIEDIMKNEKNYITKTKATDNKSEYENSIAKVDNKNVVEKDISSEKVVKGNTVKARCLETDDVSNYIVDYISGTNKIPPLAKMFLDCGIGDVVEFKGKSYRVEEVV